MIRQASSASSENDVVVFYSSIKKVDIGNADIGLRREQFMHQPTYPNALRTTKKQHGALMWWPADTPFEVALGGILTQATSWRNEAGLSRFSRLARLRVKSRYRQRRYRVTQIAFLSPTNLSERFAPGQKAAGAWTPAQLLATSQT